MAFDLAISISLSGNRWGVTVAVSAVVDWRLNTVLVDMWCVIDPAEWFITLCVTYHSLTVRSCVCWMTELPKTYAPLTAYFTAVAFLHVAYRISRTGFTDAETLQLTLQWCRFILNFSK